MVRECEVDVVNGIDLQDGIIQPPLDGLQIVLVARSEPAHQASIGVE